MEIIGGKWTKKNLWDTKNIPILVFIQSERLLARRVQLSSRISGQFSNFPLGNFVWNIWTTSEMIIHRSFQGCFAKNNRIKAVKKKMKKKIIKREIVTRPKLRVRTMWKTKQTQIDSLQIASDMTHRIYRSKTISIIILRGLRRGNRATRAI